MSEAVEERLTPLELALVQALREIAARRAAERDERRSRLRVVDGRRDQ